MKLIPDTKFWVEITNCYWCKGAVPVMSLPFEKGRGWEGGIFATLAEGVGVNRRKYCYEGINVKQQGDGETRNKTITVASFLFIFSIIIFCKVE